MLKITFLFIFINALRIIPVFGQVPASVHEDMWVCPVFETGLYGISNPSFGGGGALGYGDRLAFGIKVMYWGDREDVRALEVNFLARFYFFGLMRAEAFGAEALRHSGLFIQADGGPAIFTKPSVKTTISAGLSLGWRFLLGRHFFVEPAIRGGYPYIAGAGLSAGFRF
jgi:hypothetical protein